MTQDDTATRRDPIRRPARAGPARLGLSGKLLMLTILFVMIAEVLIYVPSIANFRLNWLNDRLAAAHTAALVLDAAPSGMVPDTPGAADPQQRRRPRGGDEDGHASAACSRSPTCRRRCITRSTCATCRGTAPSSTRSARCCAHDNDAIRVVGPAPMGGDFVEIVLDEAPLRQAMLRFSTNILLLSLLISGITAMLVYFALHYLLVRPMRRVTANMMAFRADPENPARVIARPAAATRSAWPSASSPRCSSISPRCCSRRAGSPSLGLAVSKINHDLRNLLTSAQLFSEGLAHLPDPRVQRFAPKLMRALERAIAFCESTLSYGRAQEPPPDRRPVELEPIVEEVRDTLQLADSPHRLDHRDRARADRRRRRRSAASRHPQSLAQRRAGAGDAGAERSGARPGAHHRPARGRGGGDRGLRHRAGLPGQGAGSICSSRSRARRAPAAPASASSSPASWSAPTAARSRWSKAPSARPSGSPSPTARWTSKRTARRGQGPEIWRFSPAASRAWTFGPPLPMRDEIVSSSRVSRPRAGISLVERQAPVAQLDRALDYEFRGREFESLRARQ